VRPCGNRRLDYNHFLEAIVALAIKKFPDESPVAAFAMLMSKHFLGLVSNDADVDGSSHLAMLADLKEPPRLPPGVTLEMAATPIV